MKFVKRRCPDCGPFVTYQEKLIRWRKDGALWQGLCKWDVCGRCGWRSDKSWPSGYKEAI